MKRKIFFLLFLLQTIFFPSLEEFTLMAKQEGGQRYYDMVYLGEKDFPLYVGPLDPQLKIYPQYAEVKFLDQIYYETFFQRELQENIFEWEDLWEKELPLMSFCPNFYLNENIDYIRYLYRLITISYLFESMKSHAQIAYKLKLKDRTCSLNWEDIFGKCSPKGKDMSVFIRRTKYRYLLHYDLFSERQLKRGEFRKWLTLFQNRLKKEKTLKGRTIVDKRVHDWCFEKGNCSSFSLRELEKGISHICQKDRELIHLLCSEKDSFYGLEKIKEARDLILKSNVVRVINEGGHAGACLQRFSTLFREREVEYEWLRDLFPYVRKDLKRKKKGDLQGEIFIPGALKEFDDRGLTAFLFVAPTPTPIPPQVKPTPLPTVAKLKPTPTPKPIPLVPTPIPKPLPPPPKREIPRESQFEVALHKLVKNNLSKSDVDMVKFKSEFNFIKRIIKAVEGPLKDYQTRQALIDMKTYDKLGTKNQPVRLLFLKLLIDKGAHTGLWNIVSVLGNEFYVINDLDRKKIPVVIRLHNSQKTKSRWQITILSEREYLKKKERKTR